IDHAIYWVNPDQAAGFSYEHPQGGIVLDGALFTDINGSDPYAEQRFRTITHELAHAAFNMSDADVPNQTGRVPGPPYAHSAEAYCTRQTEHNPWTNSGGAGGGGDGGASSCVTISVDHYWYFPDNGEYVYRYTTSTTYCNHNME